MRKFNRTFALSAGLLLAFATAIPAQAQTFTTLFRFDISDGYGPEAALVQGTDGNLYGTTTFGGNRTCSNGCGTVFKMTPSGALKQLYTFCHQANCTDGLEPTAALVLATDQNFYGTTSSGGTNACYHGYGCGTVFKITAAGSLTTLYNFCSLPGCADGKFPGQLLLATDGSFYGVTVEGGTVASCDCGTVFKLAPGGKLTTLHSFDVTDGYYPSSLIQGNDGNFYGTTEGTEYDGEYCSYSGPSTSCGTVFKITPEGVLTTLHVFGFTDGQNPLGALVEAANGSLTGTTAYGGYTAFEFCGAGCGTVFEISSQGAFNTLHAFRGTDGDNPYSGLVLATDGNYYGTTLDGFDVGTLYKIPPNNVTVLYDFSGTGIDGGYPWGPLIQSTNGILYGTSGGETYSSDGTIYSESVGLGPFVETVPAGAKARAQVLILGNNLGGSTSVTFNGIAATFTVSESGTYISTTVPTGATSGTVQVVTPGGTLTSNLAFRVIP